MTKERIAELRRDYPKQYPYHATMNELLDEIERLQAGECQTCKGLEWGVYDGGGQLRATFVLDDAARKWARGQSATYHVRPLHPPAAQNCPACGAKAQGDNDRLGCSKIECFLTGKWMTLAEWNSIRIERKA